MQPWAQVDTRWGGLVQGAPRFTFMGRAFFNHVRSDGDEYLQRVGATSLGNRLYQNVLDVEARGGANFAPGGVPVNVTLGVNYRLKHITWNFLDGDHVLNHFAGYAQAQARFLPNLSAVASLRVDVHPVLDAPIASPRLAVIFKPTERRALRLSGGTSFRTPTMLELYLDLQNPTSVPGVAVRGQGGEVYPGGRLRAENAVSVDLGFQDRTSDVFQYEVNAFYMRGTDLIELSNVAFAPLPGVTNPGGPIDVGYFRFVNDAAATTLLGAEVALRVSPLEGLDLYANYTFASAPPTRPPPSAATTSARRSTSSTSAPSSARASASTSRSTGISSRAPCGASRTSTSPAAWSTRTTPSTGTSSSTRAPATASSATAWSSASRASTSPTTARASTPSARPSARASWAPSPSGTEPWRPHAPTALARRPRPRRSPPAATRPSTATPTAATPTTTSPPDASRGRSSTTAPRPPSTPRADPLGRVVLLLFRADNPPPPDGFATTAETVQSFPASQLFRNVTAFPNGRVRASVAFVFPEIAAPGEYQLRAFVSNRDEARGFHPLFTVRNQPQRGDVAGGAVVDPAARRPPSCASPSASAPTPRRARVDASPTRAPSPAA